jgi:hypothetical protein
MNKTMIAERLIKNCATGEMIICAIRSLRMDDGAWVCSVVINGPGVEINNDAYGEDSLQALGAGFKMLVTEIKDLEESNPGKFVWGESLDLVLGLRFK